MKANKLFRISEIAWLVITSICVLTDLFIFIFQRDTQKGVLFLGMTFMALIMYFVRRRMRIRADLALGENQAQSADKKNKRR
jgi:hypothetical protein